jgi:anti-sigma regulatory factor (Ser/Thr protein kinase)
VVGAWATYSTLMIGLYEAARFGPERTFRWSVPIMFVVGAYWAAVTPLVAALTRRFAPARVGPVRSLALHAVAALAVAVAGIAVRWLAFRVVTPEDVPTPWRLFARLVDYHLLLYGLVALLSTAVEAHRAYVARTERALALGAQLSQARLEFLQRQLQPHFLFNALNTAAELTRESADAAARLLGQLRRLFDAATACRVAEVPLREELRVLDAYVDVQRARFGDTLVVSTRAGVDALDAAVPPLLLQPLVENAIHHGLAARLGQGRVRVTAERDVDQLVLRVRDTGDRPPADVARGRGHGIGLRNTEERLQRLYGDAGRLQLEHRDGAGTVVTVTIPFRHAAPTPPAAETAPAPFAPGALPAASVELSGAAADGGSPAVGVHAASRAAALAAASSVPEVTWRAVAAVWIACATCWTMQAIALSIGMASPWWRSVIVELTSTLVWVLLTPVVLWLGRHLRVRRSRWALPALAHVMLGLLVGAVHLTLTYAISAWEMPGFSVGVVNPLTLDVVIYLALVAWAHARDFVSWYRERGVAAARLEADLRNTRLQSLAVELRPAFVTSLLRRSGELALTDAARAEAVLERLADVLRALLDDPGRPPTVASEAALLDDCLALHALAGGRRLRVHVSAPRALLAAGVPAGAVRQVLDWVALGAVEDADVIALEAHPPHRLEIRAARDPLAATPAAAHVPVPAGRLVAATG